MAKEEKLWGYTGLEIVTEEFWTRFSEKKRELRTFAVAQKSKFPASFVDEFITRLDRMTWSESKDPQYEMAKKVMRRLVVLKSDPTEFVSSIFELEKKSKRILDKERKKEKKKSQTPIPEPTWDQIEDYISKFWNDFLVDRPDFRAFAESRRGDFPESFIDMFIKNLDGLRWSLSNDPQFQVAAAAMNILASPAPLPVEAALVAGFLADRGAEERAKKEENERAKKEEEERRVFEREEWGRIAQAEMKELQQKKKDQTAFNKSMKKRKDEATKQNKIKRLGGKAIGL